MMVQFILTQSNRYGDIIQYFTAKWECKERNVAIYYKHARDAILSTREEDMAFQKGEALAQVNDVIFKSFKINDFKTALAAIKTKMDLQGLAEPARLHIDQTNRERPDKATVIAQLTKIADDRGISLEELCRREGINLETYG